MTHTNLFIFKQGKIYNSRSSTIQLMYIAHALCGAALGIVISCLLLVRYYSSCYQINVITFRQLQVFYNVTSYKKSPQFLTQVLRINKECQDYVTHQLIYSTRMVHRIMILIINYSVTKFLKYHYGVENLYRGFFSAIGRLS